MTALAPMASSEPSVHLSCRFCVTLNAQSNRARIEWRRRRFYRFHLRSTNPERVMRNNIYKFEAEECRRQAATAFHGKPEGAFLLRLAGMFDELARDPARVPRA